MKKSAKDETVYLRHMAIASSALPHTPKRGGRLFWRTRRRRTLSAVLKAAHPAVDWRTISGFRNVLAHDYLDVDWEQVWEIVTSDLPPLEQEAAAMLQELSADNS